jgi:hypothetical protein
VTLGKQIVNELGLDNSVDTLARWMAHRVAELIERAEHTSTDEERDLARRECSDLIIRLWERRTQWPYGRPLGEVAEFLENLINEPSRYNQTPQESDKHTWVGSLLRLLSLLEREEAVCRNAAIAELNLEKEREWLSQHSEDLSAEEVKIIERLLDLRKRLDEAYHPLDNTHIPNFTSLPAEERTRHVIEALNSINAKRQVILSAIQSTKGNSETSQENES